MCPVFQGGSSFVLYVVKNCHVFLSRVIVIYHSVVVIISIALITSPKNDTNVIHYDKSKKYVVGGSRLIESDMFVTYQAIYNSISMSRSKIWYRKVGDMDRMPTI